MSIRKRVLREIGKMYDEQGDKLYWSVEDASRNNALVDVLKWIKEESKPKKKKPKDDWR